MKSEYINCKNCKDDCRCRGKDITPICISFSPVKTTNADRIRAMTDEELAEYMIGVAQQGGIPSRGKPMRWIDWLKSPVGDTG